MAKHKAAGPIKSFTNLDEVFDRMLELGFFASEDHRDEQKETVLSYDPSSPTSQNEYWFSNGVVEVKIFRQMFGSYELCNYRLLAHENLDELFELAEIPVISR